MYANLDRDTQPEAVMERIKLWIPAGRTLYIATDEKQIHYFDKLSSKYALANLGHAAYKLTYENNCFPLVSFFWIDLS